MGFIKTGIGGNLEYKAAYTSFVRGRARFSFGACGSVCHADCRPVGLHIGGTGGGCPSRMRTHRGASSLRRTHPRYNDSAVRSGDSLGCELSAVQKGSASGTCRAACGICGGACVGTFVPVASRPTVAVFLRVQSDAGVYQSDTDPQSGRRTHSGSAFVFASSVRAGTTACGRTVRRVACRSDAGGGGTCAYGKLQFFADLILHQPVFTPGRNGNLHGYRVKSSSKS